MDVRSIDSCCKINLFLRVTGRREDGYHTLETLFLPIPGLADTLSIDFAAAEGIRLETAAGLPSGKDNIAFRAAEAYAAVSGLSPAWSIKLEKRIPVAAGLGGGSSDAAGVLRLLETRFHALGDEELRRLALRLGADVPFFLDPVPAVARGVGEELEALTSPLPKLYMVLANPGFPVSAKWAYCHMIPATSAGTLTGLLAALEKRAWDEVARNIRNDLAGALWQKFPLLTVLKEDLRSCGAFAVEVSGSGSTLFALFDGAEAARRAAERLSEAHPSSKIFALEA